MCKGISFDSIAPVALEAVIKVASLLNVLQMSRHSLWSDVKKSLTRSFQGHFKISQGSIGCGAFVMYRWDISLHELIYINLYWNRRQWIRLSAASFYS